MANHPFVPTTAQSGARRIGVSVKTLASFFAQNLLVKTLAKTPFRGPDDRIQRARAFYGPTNFKFVTAISTLVCEIHTPNQAMEEL
jgi:hypothetical protein